MPERHDEELGIIQEYVNMNCDSQSVIHLLNHPVYHERTKYSDICLHFIRGNDRIKGDAGS